MAFSTKARSIRSAFNHVGGSSSNGSSALITQLGCLTKGRGFGLPQVALVCLEAEQQPKFNLSGCAKGVNTGSDTYPSNIVSDGVGSVDLPDGSRQQPIQRG
jgi:hypothetical protein